MVISRVFGFISITLCCMCCLCGQATVSKGEAEQKMKNAKKLTVNALKMAEYELREAERVKRNTEWYENKAEETVTEAENAAKVAPEDNTEANQIVTILKNQLKNARTLYPNAKNDTEKAINFMVDALSKARALNHKAEMEILPNVGSANDYTKVSEIALIITNEAEALEKEIEIAKKLLRAAKSIIWIMPAPKEEDLIKKYKDDGIVAGSVFAPILIEADSVIKSIEQKKNDVSAAVEAISELLKNTPEKSTQRINRFFTTAQGNLVTISQKVKEVYKGKQSILSRKQYAEISTKNLKNSTNVTAARKELRFIKYYSEISEETLERMKETLKSSDRSVLSANLQKQSAIQELSKSSREINGEVGKATVTQNQIVEKMEIIPKKIGTEQKNKNKPEESTEKNTEPPPNNATVKPSMINTEKKIIGTSKKSAHEEADKQEMEKKVQSKDPKSGIPNIDKLREGKKNTTKIARVGKNTQDSRAWSDSSMIVSFPLLITLIASAILH